MTDRLHGSLSLLGREGSHVVMGPSLRPCTWRPGNAHLTASLLKGNMCKDCQGAKNGLSICFMGLIVFLWSKLRTCTLPNDTYTFTASCNKSMVNGKPTRTYQQRLGVYSRQDVASSQHKTRMRTFNEGTRKA